MADTKKDVASQGTPTARADQDTDTKPVVDLLASILNEVQARVQGKQPNQLDVKALEAIGVFQQIEAALTLQPAPGVGLTAEPLSVPYGGEVTLKWWSTGASTVEIAPGIGKVPDPAGGNMRIRVYEDTVFIVTAVGPCSNATTKAPVSVDTA